MAGKVTLRYGHRKSGNWASRGAYRMSTVLSEIVFHQRRSSLHDLCLCRFACAAGIRRSKLYGIAVM